MTNIQDGVPFTDGTIDNLTAAITRHNLRESRKASNNQDLLGVGAGVYGSLEAGNRSATIQLFGDSTGDTATEWFGHLGTLLGEEFPGYTVWFREWDSTAQAHANVGTILQTGTNGDRKATFTAGELSHAGNVANIPDDLEITMRVDSPDWTPAAAQTLVANYETATALRSWRLELGTNGKLTLAWSEDGTAVKTAQSSVAVGATEGTPIWIKVVHDVDNDASGNDVIFYTSTDQTLAEPTSWTQLGTTVTTATATSHYATTAPYTLGGYNAVGAGKFTGDIYIVHVKNGIAGYDVVPCFPEHWDFYGGTGSATVKYSGSSVLTLLNSSQSGQNVAYWDDATRRVRATPPQGQQLFFISTGHNDSNMQGNLFIAAMQTFVDHLKTIKSGVPFVIVSQNPVAIVAGSAYFPDSTYQYSIDIRQGRQKKILSWASSQAGVYPLDTQRAFDGLTLTDYLNSDGLHPNAAGSQVWGEFVYDQLFSQ